VSLDPASGRELWSAGAGGFYSPTLYDGRLYANGWFSVFAADPATGEILQTFPSRQEVITTPTVAGDLLLFGTIDGALHAIRRDQLSGSPLPNVVAAATRR
jgi:outer membrane protein assembly factor BamB